MLNETSEYILFNIRMFEPTFSKFSPIEIIKGVYFIFFQLPTFHKQKRVEVYHSLQQ